ncbi:MAG: pantetheine-phosphate adenylyltransferase [Flavobacteriia bacterium]|jgi:pantetheine-phosphate adenylyltransferase|nr:pantetheine-phosphate adenylyltransferase [Flavobacteriia bacterium]
MKKGLFPGSFDPFTKGHEAIVVKAINLFDEIYIGIGINSSKKYLFDIEKRIIHIKELFKKYPNVQVGTYQKLTVDYCKEIDASHIIRGLRNSSDFEYEKTIAHMNNAISGIETVFFLSDEKHSALNSSIIREMYNNKADISPFVTFPNLLAKN